MMLSQWDGSAAHQVAHTTRSLGDPLGAMNWPQVKVP